MATSVAAPTGDEQRPEDVSASGSMGCNESADEPNSASQTGDQATTANSSGQKPTDDLSLADKHLEDVGKVLKKLAALSDKNTNELSEYKTYVENEIQEAQTKLKSFQTPRDADVVSDQTQTQDEEIRKFRNEEIPRFRKAVTKLKLGALTKYKNQSAAFPESHNKDQSKKESIIKQVSECKNLEVLDKLNLLNGENFAEGPEVKDFQVLYNSLERAEHKMCLLSFSIFPENVTVSKRFLTYWWVAEGFVALSHEANDVFKDFLAMGFIEPVIEKRGQVVKKCMIHPFVRYMLILQARRVKFLDFDDKAKIRPGFSSRTACLILKDNELPDPIEDSDAEHVQMLFNVDSDFLYLKPESLQKMKNVSVVSLGRWQTSPQHHIEVEDVPFLDGLKHTKYVRFLSLQGISGITKLPGSIKELECLLILDLRACHDLEQVPKEIGYLKSLTVLGMSECFLLDHMPKGINSLTNLEVLKGFVVGEQKTDKTRCGLDDLTSLKELRKLGIYTGRRNFPKDDELRSLNKLRKLRKLKIEWGGDSQKKPRSKDEQAEQTGDTNGDVPTPPEATPKNAADKQQNRDGNPTIVKEKSPNKSTVTTTNTANGQSSDKQTKVLTRTRRTKNKEPGIPELPTELEKLNLQSFPGAYADWITAAKLKNLKKLCIRGGTLCDLGQFQPAEDRQYWKVKTLRLKFLKELEMDWIEFRRIFPKVTYLETEDCPKLTLLPCDSQGVWMDKAEK
ncbi:hypothetical protein NMG60_11012558 [Bertholletia excelsa]